MRGKCTHFFLSFFLSGALYAAPIAYVTDIFNAVVWPFDTSTLSFGDSIPVGTVPSGVAFTPDGATAYVANLISNNVTVIDVDTNSVMATIDTPAQPMGIAVTNDGKFVYVCGTNPSTIFVIDTATNTVTSTLTNVEFTSPAEITMKPNSTLAYFTNSSGNHVLPIDTSDNNIGLSIATGNNPIGIAITQDGSTAYVANNNNGMIAGNTVTAINIGASTTTSIPITFSYAPYNVAITSDGKTAYVCASNLPAVIPIDVASNTVGTIFTDTFGGGGSNGIVIAPNGTNGFITEQGGSVGVFSIPSNQFSSSHSPPPTESILFAIAIAPAQRGRLTRIPFPPKNLEGMQKNNRFAFESELFNILTWNPSASTDVVSYNVYRNDVLIDKVSASSSLKIEDHNQKKNEEITYTVTALLANGAESKAEVVTIP